MTNFSKTYRSINGCRINVEVMEGGGDCRHLGCLHEHHLLVSSFIPQEAREWGKEDACGDHYISSYKFYFIRVHDIWCMSQVKINPLVYMTTDQPFTRYLETLEQTLITIKH